MGDRNLFNDPVKKIKDAKSISRLGAEILIEVDAGINCPIFQKFRQREPMYL